MNITKLSVLTLVLVLAISSAAEATYAPTLGRWLQRDPIKHPAGSNLYEYAATNPLFWVDPLGLDVVFKKGPGCSDEDFKKCKELYECAKNRRNPDGTKGEGVQGIEDLESRKDKTVTIECGKGGNYEKADDDAAGKDPKRGSNSTVRFDPNKKGKFSDGTERDPESSLVHELRHAKRDADGTTPGSEEGQERDAGGVENEHRRNKGIDQRKTYGKWPLKQYPPPAKPPSTRPGS